MSSQEQSPSETKEAVSISMQLMREQIGSGVRGGGAADGGVGGG